MGEVFFCIAVVKKVDLSFKGSLWYWVSEQAAVSTEIGFQQENRSSCTSRKPFVLHLPYAQQIQFWEFIGGSNLVQAVTTLILGWSNVAQYHTIPRTNLLSCPSQFILWQQRAVKNNFQEKELSHECSTLRLSVAAAATVYQDLTSGQDWEMKARNSLQFFLWSKNIFFFLRLNPFNARNLIPEIHGCMDLT